MADNLEVKSTSVTSASKNEVASAEVAVTECSKYQPDSNKKGTDRYVQVTILGIENEEKTEDGTFIIEQVHVLNYFGLDSIQVRRYYMFFINENAARIQLEIHQRQGLRASQNITSPSIVKFTGPDTGFKISDDTDTHYLRARGFFPFRKRLTTGQESRANHFSMSTQSYTSSGILVKIRKVGWLLPFYFRYDSISDVVRTDFLYSNVSEALY